MERWLGPSINQRQETECLAWTGLGMCAVLQRGKALVLEDLVAKILL